MNKKESNPSLPMRRSPPSQEESSPEEPEALPYEKWTTAELRTECDNRDPPVEYARTAKRDRLIKLLEVDDNPPTEIGNLMAEITESMGEGVIQRGSDVPLFTYIDTTSFMLNLATAGGWAEGCGHMVYGYEGCGKTTLVLIALAATQRKYPDGMVGFVDTEKKFDPMWAAKLGVDLDRIVVVKPRTGEHAVDIIEGMVKSIEIKAVALDSIPSLCPLRIIEKSAEDPTVAERARLVGLLCSKLQVAWIEEMQRGHRFTFFCINQFRERVGQMYGDPRVLPGGRFQNYMVDSKLDLKKTEVMVASDGFELHAFNEHPFKFTKTKGAFSLKQGETRMIMDDSGREDGLTTGQFDEYATVATYAKKRGIIRGGGQAWYLQGVGGTSGVRRRFGNLAAIEQYLKDERDEYLRIQRMLIMLQRRDSRLHDFPPDGYLLDWLDGDEQERLVQGLAEMGYGEEE